MKFNSGNYSIVSTMKERPEILAAFAAHHLNLGAIAIYLFLDAPDPEAESLLARVPSCIVTVCDLEYWQSIGQPKRPESIVQRQLLNAERARNLCHSEWLIHMDSDEFLYETTPLAAELADVSPSISALRIQNVERILPDLAPFETIFSGKFRRHCDRQALTRRIYGARAKYLRKGLTGYSRGKVAFRTFSDFALTLHLPTEKDAEQNNLTTCQSTEILHFDGFTRLHWVSKMLRRLASASLGGNRGRKEQMFALNDAETGAQRLAFYDHLFRIEPEVEASLAAHGLLVDVAFDPSPAIARVFPGLEPDFSAQAFDRRMIQANPDWFRALDLIPA